jgi:hypothetical protein
VNRPGVGDDQRDHGADRGQLDHWAEGLIVVDVGSLGEATSLVPVQGVIEIDLMLENPLADDDVGGNMTRDKIPSVVGDQGSKLFFHGAMPVQIDEGRADKGGYWRQGWHRDGRQGESVG